MNEMCPKATKCALFNGNILKRKESAETYRNLYCKSAKRFKECKRFIISEKVGRCADYIMPNSFTSTKELIERMRSEGLIE